MTAGKMDWEKLAVELKEKGVILVIEHKECNLVVGKINEKEFMFSGVAGRGRLLIEKFSLEENPNDLFIQALSASMNNNPFCQYQRRDKPTFTVLEWEVPNWREHRKKIVEQDKLRISDIFYPPATLFAVQYE